MGCEQGQSQSGQARSQLSGGHHGFWRSRFPHHPRPGTLAGRKPVYRFGPVIFRGEYWLSSTPNAGIISASPARGPRAAAKENNMKKASAKTGDKEMQPEYDFSTGVRGKYFRRYRRGTNVVVLEPDVAKFFSDAQ